MMWTNVRVSPITIPAKRPVLPSAVTPKTASTNTQVRIITSTSTAPNMLMPALEASPNPLQPRPVAATPPRSAQFSITSMSASAAMMAPAN